MIVWKAPIKYEISAGRVTPGSVETLDPPVWQLSYVEYFTEEDWKEAREDTIKALEDFKKAFDVLGVEFEADLDDEENKASIFLKGTKNVVMGFLASEFIAFSEVGDITLREILGMASIGMAKMGAQEEIAE